MGGSSSCRRLRWRGGGMPTMCERFEVSEAEDPQAEYDRLLALVLRQGSWLTGPQAMSLAPEEWERQFETYRENLEQVRRLGDALPPIVELSGETSALLGEVQELFSA